MTRRCAIIHIVQTGGEGEKRAVVLRGGKKRRLGDVTLGGINTSDKKV